MRDLSFRYEGRRLPALRDVSLDVDIGEAVLLLGRSGAGKSTLALCLNGLIPHSVPGRFSGQVLVDGLATATTPVHELAQRVGIIFQDPEAQFCMLTVEEEVAFGLENLRTPPGEIDPLATQALLDVGLDGFQQRHVDRLSGGQQQRLALAAALALRPRVLVFDEPTANLDPQGAQDVFALLRHLKRQSRHALVIIEHRLDDVMDLVDRVVVLDDRGGILVDAAPQQVFTEYGETLGQLGVWQPQVTTLARRLSARHLYQGPLPVTLDDAVQRFRPLVTKPDAASTPASSGYGHALPSGGVSSRTDGAPVPEGSEPAEQLPASPLTPAVEARDLSFAYGDTSVLHDLSLAVTSGDFAALVGPNGAGKTTLAALYTGLLHPTAGTVLVQGQEARDQSPAALAQHIGYVFQNPEHQFLETTVRDEVAYGLRVRGSPPAEVDRRTDEALERFGLARYARAHPYTLSHGEKRRLSVATALVLEPAMLILDEPTFGQDAAHAAALLDWLAALHADGRTVLAITHDVTTVARYARAAAVLEGGTIRFLGAARDLFARDDLLAAARLTLPPLGRLARQLHLAVEHRLTVEDWETALDPSVATARTGRSDEGHTESCVGV
ncbi:MAG: energy-coupling factor ABC transporter ATP-binding protein [Dehalococcoidia bacterium]|nr:energy-coupling factor ABC transporter ATP-binding protein [Dehalococcoidia bacterium]